MGWNGSRKHWLPVISLPWSFLRAHALVVTGLLPPTNYDDDRLRLSYGSATLFHRLLNPIAP